MSWVACILLKMRLLHFADLHLDTPFAWAPPPVAARRRQAIRDTLSAICAIARDRKVDALTCGGDLYEHDRFTADTAAFLVATFADLHPLPVLISPGNHDWLSPASIYRTAKWSPNVRIFENDRLEPYQLSHWLTLWGAAHRAPANTDDFLRDFHARAQGVNVGLFHGTERSGIPDQGAGKEPHAAFSAYEIGSAGLVHALLGHFHMPIDGSGYTYPGNPEPLSFGETGVRGAVLVEVNEDSSIRRERVPVTQTVIQDLSVDVSSSATAQDVLDRVGAALAGRTGLARVSLKGEVSPTLMIEPGVLDGVRAGLEYVQFDTRGLWPAYDLDEIGQEKTVRGQFVRDVLESDLDEGERRSVIVTGLRALAGRSDLKGVP